MHRTLLASIAALLVVSIPAPSALAEDPNRAPKDAPVAVLDLVSEAQAKGSARDWKAAVALWERVVQLNPVNAQYWFALGDARHQAGELRQAIAAYERAAELGAPLMGGYVSIYRIARCQAQLGEKELALRALERALALGYPSLSRPAAEPDLASLRDDPRFKKMLGLVDVANMSREEGWRSDLALLA